MAIRRQWLQSTDVAVDETTGAIRVEATRPALSSRYVLVPPSTTSPIVEFVEANQKVVVVGAVIGAAGSNAFCKLKSGDTDVMALPLAVNTIAVLPIAAAGAWIECVPGAALRLQNTSTTAGVHATVIYYLQEV